ncbi:hypothetical protein PGT21_002519 [Puccinia graminis f. sp. tritici]|uniref:Uncharacterized protein n=1 Tax=Puccinia graminis f. sp. tritici TaxID=56615 RepID=A0A5B0PMU9_PUCGR|nr:hypothetical protein PGT21_002519 [Puccinia graminis f. sp. tritici]
MSSLGSIPVLETCLRTIVFRPVPFLVPGLNDPAPTLDSNEVQDTTFSCHSKITGQTPILIESSPALSPMAEEMEISMLLTPPGFSIYDGDCFTQPEFDALFAFVMNQIALYCRDNFPKNFIEHEARVKLYMDISRGFKFANVHNLIPKYEDGMPRGSSSGGNHSLRRILQVVD